MVERFQLYVRASSNYPPGLPLQTFERLGPEWKGESLHLRFFSQEGEARTLEVVGWTGSFAVGRACPVHVTRVRWLPQHSRPAHEVATGPAEPMTGYLVWGGDSGLRVLDPEAAPEPGAGHLPRGFGQPLIWLENPADLPAEVQEVVAAEE
jgi:hypothetical protein